jgi:hypothetical protein
MLKIYLDRMKEVNDIADSAEPSAKSKAAQSTVSSIVRVLLAPANLLHVCQLKYGTKIVTWYASCEFVLFAI